jgi:arsenate reductase (thioredoxin)
MTHRILKVLFLCTGNSARSVMAESILNRLGRGEFRAFSAGSKPKEEIHPNAKKLLEQQNFDTSTLRSKSWDEFALPDSAKMDFVFTVCDDAANEDCPVWPGQPMSAHWGVPDRAKATGSDVEIALAFADAYRMLNARISVFVSLPIASLDKLSLRIRLNNIGAMERVPAGQPLCHDARANDNQEAGTESLNSQPACEHQAADWFLRSGRLSALLEAFGP